MLWIFERKGEQMRCEIRRDGVGAGYEMIVTSADGSQRMERFDETNDLIKRTFDLQRELMETGWRQPKPYSHAFNALGHFAILSRIMSALLVQMNRRGASL